MVLDTVSANRYRCSTFGTVPGLSRLEKRFKIQGPTRRRRPCWDNTYCRFKVLKNAINMLYQRLLGSLVPGAAASGR